MPAAKKAAGVPKGAPARVVAVKKVARKAGAAGPKPVVARVAPKKKAPAKKVQDVPAKKAVKRVAKKKAGGPPIRVATKKKVAPVNEEGMRYTHPWLFELGHGASDYHNRQIGKAQPRRIDGQYFDSPTLGNNAESLKKSWDLLMVQLDEQQQADLIREGMFIVENAMGHPCVVIANLSHMNVFERAPQKTNNWCTADASHERVPIWDVICAQVLAIRFNWDYFTKVAFSLA